MPEIVTITDEIISARGYREVVVVQELPFGRFKKGDVLLAYHKMRIFIPTGKPKEYETFDMDAQLFDQYFGPVVPSDPIIIALQ